MACNIDDDDDAVMAMMMVIMGIMVIVMVMAGPICCGHRPRLATVMTMMM